MHGEYRRGGGRVGGWVNNQQVRVGAEAASPGTSSERFGNRTDHDGPWERTKRVRIPPFDGLSD
jgi:hypothetical protein